MFHTTLDAVGNILRLHYESMKCDVSFSQGSVSTLFRRGEHVFHLCVQMFFLFTAVQKLLKSNEFFQSYDHRCTAAFFLWITMYNNLRKAYVIGRLSVVLDLDFIYQIYCVSERTVFAPPSKGALNNAVVRPYIRLSVYLNAPCSYLRKFSFIVSRTL